MKPGYVPEKKPVFATEKSASALPNNGSTPDIEQQRSALYEQITEELQGFGLAIDESLSAPATPWGAYIRIREVSLAVFIKAYWKDSPELPLARSGGQRLEPKILIVAPHHRLSLQFHHRRQEHWRVVSGPVKVVLGETQETLQERLYQTGDLIEIPCGYLHRIAGLESWGVIAELWEHTCPDNPSDEDDIVRVQDDFSRKTGQT